MGPQSERNTAVLIAAFNAEATLDRAIASALAQAQTVEVCVVDDKSRDTTFSVARAWAERDRRVVALTQIDNQGPAAARNRAIEATSAPWVTILDADDYMLPGRLERLHNNASGADIVADLLVRTREGAPVTFEPEASAPRVLTLETFILGDLPEAGELNLGFLKPLVRRAFLDECGLRYDQRLRLGEDFDLYARALAHGARFLLGAPAGYVSVERPGSLSTQHGSAELMPLRDCYAGIKSIRPLTPGEMRALDRHWRFVDRRLQWSRFAEGLKAGDVRSLVSAMSSPHAAWYVLAQLGSQIWLRGTAFARQRVFTR
jgi:succinoglycan biosynthesis protein ExoU